jgi:hypothetical protein
VGHVADGRQIVHRDHVEVCAPGVQGTYDAPTDAAEAVDSYANSHDVLLGQQQC